MAAGRGDRGKLHPVAAGRGDRGTVHQVAGEGATPAEIAASASRAFVPSLQTAGFEIGESWPGRSWRGSPGGRWAGEIVAGFTRWPLAGEIVARFTRSPGRVWQASPGGRWLGRSWHGSPGDRWPGRSWHGSPGDRWPGSVQRLLRSPRVLRGPSFLPCKRLASRSGKADRGGRGTVHQVAAGLLLVICCNRLSANQSLAE